MIIANGACALPGELALRKMDMRIADGRIAALAERVEPEPGEPCVDAAGLELFPGAIDPHVHFDEPGFTHREDFRHGSMAAARGGVTTVIDMPCTSQPPVVSADALREKLSAVGDSSVVDFAFFGGVSGHSVEQSLARYMDEIAADVVGYKCYFVSGMDTFTAVDHFSFQRVARKASALGRPVLLHAEDAGIVLPATRFMRDRSQTEDRDASWDDYADSRPESAEAVAVAVAAVLTRGIEPTLHIVHVGSADAAVLAGGRCETCPHYLAFSREDFADKGSSLKTAPPVKGRGQAELLWKLLAEGSIAFLASDHAPSTVAEKNTGSVWNDYGGIPGTGTLFPYAYSEGWRKGRLDLPALLRATSAGAAARYGLSARKGSLAPGMDADIVAVNPAGEYTVRGKDLLSKGTITPFEGMRLAGYVRATYVRGALVWDASAADMAGHAADGIVAQPGHGKFIRWGYR